MRLPVDEIWGGKSEQRTAWTWLEWEIAFESRARCSWSAHGLPGTVGG